MIHISMPWADCFGAGTCGKYLIEEFARRGETFYSAPPGDDLSFDYPRPAGAVYRELTADVNMPLLQFPGPDMEQQTRFRGSPNVAYIFSENKPLTPKQVENLKAFDVLVAGSEWNARVIREAGFDCVSVPQGVDTTVFRPQPRLHAGNLDEKFVIYSGGKWEHRKAQDLVIRAVKVMQERHADVHLVCSWVNLWSGKSGFDEAYDAGLRFNTMAIASQRELARIMNTTDVGLFPNRCEGGTNLVMMDYLACGRPVVANVSSGQKDVLHHSYAAFLGGSDEDMVEQSIHHLEYLYQKRYRLQERGAMAAEAMKAWTWERTADGIAKAIEHAAVAV